MATRKNTASKITTMPPITTPSRSKRSKRSTASSRIAAEVLGKSRGSRRRGFDASSYITPGVAVLASGALAAAGYVFKDQIGDVMVDVLKAAAKRGSKVAVATSKAVDVTRDHAMEAVEKISDNISMDTLLRYAGLQRRSTVMSIVGPAIGVACGFVAGSAIAYFFGPKLLAQLGISGDETSDVTGQSRTEEPVTASSSTASPDEIRNNSGGLHRGVF